jgi:hypothetical protein
MLFVVIGFGSSCIETLLRLTGHKESVTCNTVAILLYLNTFNTIFNVFYHWHYAFPKRFILVNTESCIFSFVQLSRWAVFSFVKLSRWAVLSFVKLSRRTVFSFVQLSRELYFVKLSRRTVLSFVQHTNNLLTTFRTASKFSFEIAFITLLNSLFP